MTVASDRGELEELLGLRDLVIDERRRVDRLLDRIERVLQRKRANTGRRGKAQTLAARRSPLDDLKNVIGVTKDLRLPNGKLSVERMAKLYGVSLSQFGIWLGRSKQALSKTPDADSLQNELGYFERVARLRAVTANDAEFRKWLRMPNDTLGSRTALELIARGQWQEVADKVDDILTGMPS